MSDAERPDDATERTPQATERSPTTPDEPPERAVAPASQRDGIPPSRSGAGLSGEWEPVRDSWVNGPPRASSPHGAAAAVVEPPSAPEPPEQPSSTQKRSLPPLPMSHPPAAMPEESQTELMLERLAASDHEGALFVAQSILARDPYDRDALECAEMCGRELRKLFTSRIGSLDRVPRLAGAEVGREAQGLGFAAGIVMARVDGARTVSQIVERARLPEVDALRAVTELYLKGLIVLE